MAQQDRIQTLIDAMKALSPEEREKLNSLGAVLPNITDAKNAETIFGYRCKLCGGIALEFVGSKFDLGNGETDNKPPLGLPLDRIPWCQPSVPVNKINRVRPVCQCCGCAVFTANGYLIEKYIVRIQDYRAARAHGMKQVAAHRRKRESSMASHNPDGSPISVSSNYDLNQRQEQEVLDRNRTPETVAAVEQVAADFNLLDKIYSGPSGKRGKASQ